MIKHIVMFKLKDQAEGKDKVDNANKIKIMLDKLTEKIEELNTMEVGININDSDAAYDIVLYSEFDDQEALNNYQIHAEHQKVVEFVREVIENRVVVDYQV